MSSGYFICLQPLNSLEFLLVSDSSWAAFIELVEPSATLMRQTLLLGNSELKNFSNVHIDISFQLTHPNFRLLLGTSHEYTLQEAS